MGSTATVMQIFVAMGRIGDVVCIREGRMGYSRRRCIHVAPRWLGHVANNILARRSG